MMLSCCCSGLLQEADFLRTALFGSVSGRAAAFAGHGRRAGAACVRGTMQILARTGAAADHPVSANVPESEYLKAVWMRLN